MIDEKTLGEVAMTKELRQAIIEFFDFAEQEGISHWDRREWKVERWTPGVDTLFFRPLFSDHSRHDHIAEINIIQDFLRANTGNRRLQLGFFCPCGKNIPLREELRASFSESRMSSEFGEVDYSNLTDAVNIESILGRESGD